MALTTDSVTQMTPAAELGEYLYTVCKQLHERRAELQARREGAILQVKLVEEALNTVESALNGLQNVDPTLPQLAPDPLSRDYSR